MFLLGQIYVFFCESVTFAGMKRNFSDIMAGLDSERAQKVARKLPDWAAVDGLEIPSALSLEQCSSSATAFYKAGQAAAAANLRFAHPSHALRRGPLPFTRPRAATGLPAAPPDPAKSAGEGAVPVFAQRWGFEESERPVRSILDLTGGLGVDSWALSRVAERVVYFERNEELAAAAGRNFARLGAENIEVRCETVTAQTPLPEADLIYADPARRSAAGRKVFLLEDCSPDVLTLLPMLLERAPAVLLKLSPMADLTMLAERLGPALREIHVVELDGEVKELLCLLRRDNASPEPDILVVRLSGQATASRGGSSPLQNFALSTHPSQAGAWAPPVHEATGGYGCPGETSPDVPPMGADTADGGILRFRVSEERAAEAVYAAGVQPGDVLLEPSPALLKAGAFRLPCARWGLRKLAPSTHLYTEAYPPEPPAAINPVPTLLTQSPGAGRSTDADFASLEHAAWAPFFKAWRVIEVLPLGAAAFKQLKRRYPRAEVTARNLPLGSADLQKRLGVASGGNAHIFGCRLGDGSAVLLVCERLL
jgi:Protein-L-isoaspartate carboxylmethyltransferase